MAEIKQTADATKKELRALKDKHHVLEMDARTYKEDHEEMVAKCEQKEEMLRNYKDVIANANSQIE